MEKVNTLLPKGLLKELPGFHFRLEKRNSKLQETIPEDEHFVSNLSIPLCTHLKQRYKYGNTEQHSMFEDMPNVER